MENTDVTTTNTRAKIDPSLMIHRGGTTFLIGIRFADKGDPLEDKVKRMVKKRCSKRQFVRDSAKFLGSDLSCTDIILLHR